MSEAVNVLTAEAVTKTYQSGDRKLEVLRGVSLSVAAGETVSIRGESGSGKSTLLHILAGLDSADSGQVAWTGVKRITPQTRASFLGIVFQSFYLIPEIDARSNVLMAARMRGKLTPALRQRADTLLAQVGLAARAHHLPAELSGGERQRVAVARALMNAPQIILADEPTGNLDEKTSEVVIDLLLNLCRDTKTALVLVTHNPIQAAKCDRHLLMTHGVLE